MAVLKFFDLKYFPICEPGYILIVLIDDMTVPATIIHDDQLPMIDDLGAGVARYKSRFSGWRGFFGCLSICVLAFLLVISFAAGYALSNLIKANRNLLDSPLHILLLVIIFIIYLFWFLLARSYQHTGHYVEIYQFGAKLNLPKIGRQVWKWEDLDGVAVSVVELHYLGITTPMRWRAQLYPQTGKPVEICPEIKNLPELITRLKGAVYPARLRRYRTDFLKGQAIGFGCITIYPDRLEIQKSTRNSKKLPWSIISSLGVEKGYLIIHPQGKRRLRIPTSSILNLELFLEIVKQDIRV